MLPMGDVLSEVHIEDMNEKGLPPGFRFHPTDEELITFYLASKVFNGSFNGVEIVEIDLNRCEPWELPDVAKMGEKEWYFFSLRDRKYPTGLRTNRATEAGYWKATGKDREVYSASNGALLGMKKTLVFYKGRAPRGEKTKWVMHEYRLDGDFSYTHAPNQEEWVICRIIHKAMKGEKKISFLQAHQYLLQVSSSSSQYSTSLPPLLESQPPSLQILQQNPLFIHQKQNLETLINPNINQPNNNNNLPMSFNPPSNLLSPSSVLIKSLLSNQDSCLLKETTISKQYKPETNFSYFQQLDSTCVPNNLGIWVDKVHHNNHQNQSQKSVSFEMDNGVLGLSSATGGTVAAEDRRRVHEMSTSSVTLNRTAYQIMFDPPPLIRYSRESGPLDV